MKKKTRNAWAVGLTLTLAVAALGGIASTDSVATVKKTALVADVTPLEEQKPGWMIDGDWIAAQDTTVTDEVRKMVMDSFFHAVGSGRTPIMYLGSQITESGTNHCILCKTFPVIPYPEYRFVLYYVHEKSDGTYETYKTRLLDSSEYSEYSEIRFITLNKRSIKIKKGKKKTIRANCYPKSESVIYTWKSTNKKVATVKNGVITAKKKGSCYIVCRVKGSPDMETACAVTVK